MPAKMATSGRLTAGGLPVQAASQKAISSRRPSAPGGFVSCASRSRAATSAAEFGPGRLRNNSRKSSNGRPLALMEKNPCIS
ncbi:hypothetical protein D3C86_1807210 [compost metagenome]